MKSSAADTIVRSQFTLRSLLAIVSLSAVILAAVRWLGADVIPLILAGMGVWAFTVRNARHFFVWFVPSLWSLCALGSWHHPGDEYGMFCGSVLISLWLAVFFEVGSMDETHFFGVVDRFWGINDGNPGLLPGSTACFSPPVGFLLL